MANYLYVDNSNVWIEGMHVSAVATGLAPDVWAAQTHHICDYGWKIDFGKLYAFAGGDRDDVAKATLFGSRPPPNDSLWDAARRKGFEPIIYDRNVANREKKIDTDIVATMIEDSYEAINKAVDEITLVAGDADYVPAIEKLRTRGFRVDVVFWAHASRELREASTNFIALNEHLEYLRLR